MTWKEYLNQFEINEESFAIRPSSVRVSHLVKMYHEHSGKKMNIHEAVRETTEMGLVKEMQGNKYVRVYTSEEGYPLKKGIVEEVVKYIEEYPNRNNVTLVVVYGDYSEAMKREGRFPMQRKDFITLARKSPRIVSQVRNLILRGRK